jgi:hypothetical protein
MLYICYVNNDKQTHNDMQVAAQEVKKGDLIKFETRAFGFVTKVSKIEKKNGGFRYVFEGVSIEQERIVTGCGRQRRNKRETYPAGNLLFLSTNKGETKISAQHIK